jgi:NAD+ kinase
VIGDAIGVVVHPRRDSHEHIECVVRWAEGHGKVVRGLDEARALMPAAVKTVTEAELAPGSALVIGLGGDGTILRALKLATEHAVPVLGVNLGRLAFLAEVNLDDLPNALDQIDRGDFRMEERATMRVTGTIEGLPLTAFNDAALTRVPGHGPAAVAVEVEGDVFARYTADALVIATPTGSTAYSFAAGGPIVSPRHSGLLVTPVAPHAAFDRPVFLHPGNGCGCTCSTVRRRCCWRPTASGWPRPSRATASSSRCRTRRRRCCGYTIKGSTRRPAASSS